MVEFTNINIIDGYIYADAYDRYNKISKKIKLSCTTEEYCINGLDEKCNLIIKAFWSLQRRLKNNGILESTEVVCWG